MESWRIVGSAAPPAAALALAVAVVLPALLQASPPHRRDHRHPQHTGEQRQLLDWREKTRTCNGWLNETLAFHVKQDNKENYYIELFTSRPDHWICKRERHHQAAPLFLCHMEFRVLKIVVPGAGVNLYHTERRCSRSRAGGPYTDPATGFTYRCVDLVYTQVLKDHVEVCGPVGCVAEKVA